VEVVILSSDKGLCGGFNTNIFRKALEFLGELKQKTISITLLGKKAQTFFKRRPYTVRKSYVGVMDAVQYHEAALIGRELLELFARGERDEVYCIYNEFKSAMRQDVVAEKLFPIEPRLVEEGTHVIDYEYEPSQEAILGELLEKHIMVQVYRIMLESSTSEHGARMTAMEAATNNASDMIEQLTLFYNKARQAAITKEIIEIVSGAEALK
jgi:F-type H+-transporting ATPase subunit gamma